MAVSETKQSWGLIPLEKGQHTYEIAAHIHTTHTHARTHTTQVAASLL